MPRLDSDARITISVLDRLIDYEPEVSQEPIASRSKNLRDLKQSVRRDLEWLLNTREFIQEIAPDLKEVQHSVATYGLPDFTATSIKSPTNQDRLRRAIEAEINLFEPRLEGVIVGLVPAREDERSLRFRIEAQLKVDPAPEPVTFDTLLDQGTGRFTLKGE